MRRQRLVIVGAGGYAKSVLDSLDYERFVIHGFIDERPELEEHMGFPVVAHSLEELASPDEYVYFIAIGSNPKRRVWFDRILRAGLELVTVIDRSARVSSMSELGRGCFVGKLAIVNADVRVGDDVVVNTMALIEHGCTVGDHANISTKAVINGDVVVGEGSFIGSNSVVTGQLSIGSWTVVGAGAVVVRNVGSGVTVAGVPARKLRDEASFW